jgi:hypothetical protein
MNFHSVFKPAALATLVVGAVLVTAAASPVHAAWPADHLSQAQAWVNVIKADNNFYGDNPDIWWVGSDLYAQTKCGSFTALLLKAAYPVVTDDVLDALTTSSSPFAAEWHDAIEAEAYDSDSGIGFTLRDDVSAIQAGDILAAEYAEGSADTGHVMTVASITLVSSNVAPPYTITGVPLVNRYRVTVYDSTKSAHGSYASNPYPDTRYLKQWDTATSKWINDQGIGSGTIVIYEDPATGDLVAWAWNVSTTTADFYYSSVAPPAGSTKKQRPMVAGYLSGPGL